MTSDLVEFLRARLREDEGYAQHAATEAGIDWRTPASGVLETADDLYALGDSRLTSFICRFDPARVLTEVAAKRALLDSCEAASRSASGLVIAEEFGARLANELFAVALLRHLAAPYASHPDYQAAWSPTGAEAG